MEGIWRGWHFAMIGMKKLQDIFGWGIDTYYHLMVMHMICLPLKFLAGFVISDFIEYNLILNMFHKICLLISSPQT